MMFNSWTVGIKFIWFTFTLTVTRWQIGENAIYSLLNFFITCSTEACFLQLEQCFHILKWKCNNLQKLQLHLLTTAGILKPNVQILSEKFRATPIEVRYRKWSLSVSLLYRHISIWSWYPVSVQYHAHLLLRLYYIFLKNLIPSNTYDIGWSWAFHLVHVVTLMNIRQRQQFSQLHLKSKKQTANCAVRKY